MTLARKRCVPCRGGVPPLTAAQVAPLLAQLEGWRVVRDHHLEKRYAVRDFAQALALANAFGAVAEAEGHHPDLGVAWGRCDVSIFTHKIDGLTESDFVLAAKLDEAWAGAKLPR